MFTFEVCAVSGVWLNLGFKSFVLIADYYCSGLFLVCFGLVWLV